MVTVLGLDKEKAIEYNIFFDSLVYGMSPVGYLHGHYRVTRR